MFPFLSLVTVLTTVYGVNGLVVMLLDSTVYPTVADHHCIASLCGGLTFTSRDGGFHRATTTHYMSERRHAVGCDTTAMACGANSVCDQIPYVDTYDGGLGCYAQDWTSTGRPLSYLYSASTRRCIPVAEQAAHQKALTAFYSAMKIANYQIYSVDVAFIGKTGLASPLAVYCNRFITAYALGQSFEPICTDAANDGNLYSLVTKSQISGKNTCPSRKYRRHYPGAGISARQSNPPPPVLNFTQLANGGQTLSLFGNAAVGDQVWVHDATLTKGTTTKVTGVADSFGLLGAVGKILCGILGLLGLCH